VLKTNFKPQQKKSKNNANSKNLKTDKKDLTQEEFEEFVRKSGAAGSFMIFRSKNKRGELGLDAL